MAIASFFYSKIAIAFLAQNHLIHTIAILIPKKHDRIPHPQKARSHSPSPKSTIAFPIPKKFDRIPHPQKVRSHSPSPKSSIAYGPLRDMPTAGYANAQEPKLFQN
ncbi:hypothetical protein [Argonema galeatum]|uniref:hypothetical protein n=1 Tax=Argonema galeatum TaxID=2942762 RepID=UPI002011A3D1|nr:hypothetical protein [Argonema galeatum]MCL1464345.1 hypothetical protein [Argonema galeatum A003/A1]